MTKMASQLSMGPHPPPSPHGPPLGLTTFGGGCGRQVISKHDPIKRESMAEN